MDTLAPCIGKSERIALFIDLLKAKGSHHANIYDTHRHLEVCFKENERLHCAFDSACMEMMRLSDFVFIERFSLYQAKAADHLILIHTHGAYAMYALVMSQNVELYQQQRALVSIENVDGKTIWQ